MTSYNEDLPPELRFVADELRQHRYVASAIELDETKRRVLRRASGRGSLKGRYMRRPTFVTAAITAAAMLSGSAGALAITGNLPAATGGHHTARAAGKNASTAQYGNQCDDLDKQDRENERQLHGSHDRQDRGQSQRDRGAEARMRARDRQAENRRSGADRAGKIRSDRAAERAQHGRDVRAESSQRGRDRGGEGRQRGRDRGAEQRCRQNQ